MKVQNLLDSVYTKNSIPTFCFTEEKKINQFSDGNAGNAADLQLLKWVFLLMSGLMFNFQKNIIHLMSGAKKKYKKCDKIGNTFALSTFPIIRNKEYCDMQWQVIS